LEFNFISPLECFNFFPEIGSILSPLESYVANTNGSLNICLIYLIGLENKDILSGVSFKNFPVAESNIS
jgi:hypothetical protein